MSINFQTKICEVLIETNSGLYERLLGPTVFHALAHFPTQVITRVTCTHLGEKLIGQHINVVVTPMDHRPAKHKGGAYKIICKIIPSGHLVDIVFFYKKLNTCFLKHAFALGREKALGGRLELSHGRYTLVHPDVLKEKFPTDQRDVVYPLTSGLTSSKVHRFVQHLIDNLSCPKEWQEDSYGYPSFLNALETVHNPKTAMDVGNPHCLALRRLIHDELLAQQLALLLLRGMTKSVEGIHIQNNSLLQSSIHRALPFRLTKAQEDALNAIQSDLSSRKSMLRLLQGDVGCGKTVVCALAMADVIHAGYQCALLAPTDVLASQHYHTLSALFSHHGYQVALLTGKITGSKRREVLRALENGEIHVLIGTHALIEENVAFHQLAFIVVDEQHRFGVVQRAKLTQKGKCPHFLAMTATPIPRTLQMAICGDLDITSILEKPEGRKEILTSLHAIDKVEDIMVKLCATVNFNHKAYWICPLIEESEKIDMTAVKERFSALQQLAGNRIGLLHGKMKNAEKEKAVEAFTHGAIDILVSTTVVEVGVDVKTANVIVIEHAERFGLSQLHQLRGRVGRSNKQGHCLLLYDKLTPTGRDRLQAMRESNDGFYLAEMDLKIRGSGDFLGSQQSGDKLFHFYKGAHPQLFHEILNYAHKDAVEILNTDPKLTSERGMALRELLTLFQKDNLDRFIRAG